LKINLSRNQGPTAVQLSQLSFLALQFHVCWASDVNLAHVILGLPEFGWIDNILWFFSTFLFSVCSQLQKRGCQSYPKSVSNRSSYKVFLFSLKWIHYAVFDMLFNWQTTKFRAFWQLVLKNLKYFNQIFVVIKFISTELIFSLIAWNQSNYFIYWIIYNREQSALGFLQLMLVRGILQPPRWCWPQFFMNSLLLAFSFHSLFEIVCRSRSRFSIL
jgi:hypothetical protein